MTRTMKEYKLRAQELRKLAQIQKRLTESIALINKIVKDDPKREPDGFEIDLLCAKKQIFLAMSEFNHAKNLRYENIDLESYR